MTVIIFIIVLAVLIFVHELGHFTLARLNGIRVDEFKIGFGPRIISWGKGETKYGLNLIPFGGYVKIFGEDPNAENMHGPDSARSFINKKKYQQVMVLVAGVFFNFLFAWLLYTIVFISGVTATKDGFEAYASQFKNDRIMITAVSADSPAEKAGIVLGDVIREVKSPVTDVSVEKGNLTVPAVQEAIDSGKGGAIEMTVSRNNQTKTVSVMPTSGIVENKYAIGIALDTVADLKLSFFSSIYEGAHYTFLMIRDTVVGLYSFVANIFHGTAQFSDVTGPVGIAGIVGSAASLGITYLLMITALISINLGVINLVPFPALDGGRTLFVLIEAVIRRRIPATVANVTNTIGFALLMLLMIFVTYKDIARLIH